MECSNRQPCGQGVRLFQKENRYISGLQVHQGLLKIGSGGSGNIGLKRMLVFNNGVGPNTCIEKRRRFCFLYFYVSLIMMKYG